MRALALQKCMAKVRVMVVLLAGLVAVVWAIPGVNASESEDCGVENPCPDGFLCCPDCGCCISEDALD